MNRLVVSFLVIAGLLLAAGVYIVLRLDTFRDDRPTIKEAGPRLAAIFAEALARRVPERLKEIGLVAAFLGALFFGVLAGALGLCAGILQIAGDPAMMLQAAGCSLLAAGIARAIWKLPPLSFSAR